MRVNNLFSERACLRAEHWLNPDADILPTPAANSSGPSLALQDPRVALWHDPTVISWQARARAKDLIYYQVDLAHMVSRWPSHPSRTDRYLRWAGDLHQKLICLHFDTKRQILRVPTVDPYNHELAQEMAAYLNMGRSLDHTGAAKFYKLAYATVPCNKAFRSTSDWIVDILHQPLNFLLRKEQVLLLSSDFPYNNHLTHEILECCMLEHKLDEAGVADFIKTRIPQHGTLDMVLTRALHSALDARRCQYYRQHLSETLETPTFGSMPCVSTRTTHASAIIRLERWIGFFVVLMASLPGSGSLIARMRHHGPSIASNSWNLLRLAAASSALRVVSTAAETTTFGSASVKTDEAVCATTSQPGFVSRVACSEEHNR
jgi:hypothetical protein